MMTSQTRRSAVALLGCACFLAVGCSISATDDDDHDDVTRADGGSNDTGGDGGTTDPSNDGGGVIEAPDAAPMPGPDGGGGGTHRVIGYFAAWGVYGRDYHVADIPASKLTHINYAFANISAEGECVLGDPYADIDKFYEGDSWEAGALRGSFNQLIQLKAAHPHLKTLISVGGWTWSGRFSDVAVSAAARAKFAASCVAFMADYGFDGIDIDWEYPVSGGLAGNTTRPEDRANYTLLLAEIRRQLDDLGATSGTHYLLTIAAPAGPSIIPNLDIAALAGVLDWINLMTYDFHGAWSSTTNFNAALYPSSADPTANGAALSGHAAVQAYLAAGAPAAKLVLGVPFYGRGWAGVAATNDGLYQPFSGAPTGTWEAGVFDYHDLVANYIPTYERHVHGEAQVPWLYNAATGVMISYDDPQALGAKTDYVKSNGLGGVMFWELSGDDAGDSLLNAIQ